MPYMAQQAVTSAVRQAFRSRPDAIAQAEAASRCLAWLESLPLDAALLASIVEPIAAIEHGLREAGRAQGDSAGSAGEE